MRIKKSFDLFKSEKYNVNFKEGCCKEDRFPLKHTWQ
jgi:hypothetical protein